MTLAALVMAAALALLFLGYESSRAASIALLAAKGTGLGSEALPFAVALGSPAGGCVLYLYARSIKKNGAKYTLRVSNMFCVMMIGAMLWFSGTGADGSLAEQVAVISFYVFREIYVSLLSTQHWSFISSVLDSSMTSSIVSFSGIVSISSAVGSVGVEWLVKLGGVRALLCMCFITTLISFGFSEVAYAINGATAAASNMGALGRRRGNARSPSRRDRTASRDKAEKKDKGQKEETKEVDKEKDKDKDKDKEKNKEGEKKSFSFWGDSFKLLHGNHTLQLLLAEAVLHQGCSNLLNLIFHDGVRHRLSDDGARATLVGRFFAMVNTVACGLQLFVMPKLLSHETLPFFLLLIPVLVGIATSFALYYQNLVTVMLGFGTMKVLEYSIMSSAMEMIYMPMGHDVRYLGKELVRFFGHKLGKSSTSLVLSYATSVFQPQWDQLALWSISCVACWGGTMSFLSAHIASKNDELVKAHRERERLREEENERREKEGVLLTPSVIARRNRERSGTLTKDGLIFASMITPEDEDDEDYDDGDEEAKARRAQNRDKDFDYRFYYRPLEGAAAKEEDGLALISLERSLSASAADLAGHNGSLSAPSAGAGARVGEGVGAAGVTSRDFIHTNAHARPRHSSLPSTAAHAGEGPRTDDDEAEAEAEPALSVETTEPADSPPSDSGSPVGLQLSPDLPVSYARAPPGAGTMAGKQGFGLSSFLSSSGTGKGNGNGGAEGRRKSEADGPGPRLGLSLRQRLAAKLGLRHFSEDPREGDERGHSRSPLRARTGSEQYINRDLFDSTGFYVGLNDRGGSRDDLSSLVQRDTGGEFTVRAAMSATAGAGGGRSASESSDSTAEDLVSCSNGSDSREGSLSLPLGAMATMALDSPKLSPSVGFRGLGDISAGPGRGLGSAKRKVSTRPSMIRVGSSSVSLNYLSALADAGKDEEDSGVWGGGG